MALDPVKNKLYTTLASGIVASATSMTVATGTGSNFPDPVALGQYNLVIYNSTDYPSASLDPQSHYVRVTALTGDVFTIQQPSSGNNYNGEGDDNIAYDHNTVGKTYAVERVFSKNDYDTIGSNIDSKEDALGYTPEDVANKSTDIITDASSSIKYPTVKSIKDYADGLIAGLLDYRGGYDASGNTYPVAGGSGTAGAVLKGDMWIISVAGSLGGEAVQVGDSIIANVDTPDQTASKWNHLNANISYVPENLANKKTDLTDNSDTYYPTQKAVKTAVDEKQDTLTFGIANTNAVKVDDASVADNDYAKFTANGIEGVPYSTVLSDIGAQAALGFIAEDSANKKTDLTDNSDTYYPSQKAVKTAVDAKAPLISPSFTTPNLGAATGTSLDLEGTTLKMLSLKNTDANSYTRMLFDGTGVDFAQGVGNANAAITDLRDKFYIYDFTNSKTAFTIAPNTLAAKLYGSLEVVGGLTLATGTTTVFPLKMVAGTNLTTPVAGVFEFDGTNLYFSV